MFLVPTPVPVGGKISKRYLSSDTIDRFRSVPTGSDRFRLSDPVVFRLPDYIGIRPPEIIGMHRNSSDSGDRIRSESDCRKSPHLNGSDRIRWGTFDLGGDIYF